MFCSVVKGIDDPEPGGLSGNFWNGFMGLDLHSLLSLATAITS